MGWFCLELYFLVVCQISGYEMVITDCFSDSMDILVGQWATSNIVDANKWRIYT